MAQDAYGCYTGALGGACDDPPPSIWAPPFGLKSVHSLFSRLSIDEAFGIWGGGFPSIGDGIVCCGWFTVGIFVGFCRGKRRM